MPFNIFKEFLIRFSRLSILAFAMIFSSIFVSCAFVSCASTGFSGKAELVGRVCDSSGNPVPGYRVSFDGAGHVVSGVNGMFVLHDVNSGYYDIKGSKKGWTSINETIEFFDRRSVLVIQVAKMSDAFTKIDSALFDGDIESARSILNSEIESNGNEPLFAFYSALVDYCALSGTDSDAAEAAKTRMDDILGDVR